jgi:hypothetical protein
MISLEFPRQKEVILFESDWYDVPAASTSRARGYNKDQFGVIDIDTTRTRYENEPYILATQAELVFYVDLVNKPGWRSVIAMKPRDLFAMPELELEDSIDVGIHGINDLLGGQEDLTTSWTRSDKEGTTGDVSVIAQVQAEATDEPDHVALLDDDEYEEDDMYIDDGVVAPIVSGVQSQDDEFFI